MGMLLLLSKRRNEKLYTNFSKVRPVILLKLKLFISGALYWTNAPSSSLRICPAVSSVCAEERIRILTLKFCLDAFAAMLLIISSSAGDTTRVFSGSGGLFGSGLGGFGGC